MKKIIMIAFVTLSSVVVSYASFTYTASCGAQAITSFGNLDQSEYVSYLMELDEILCN